MITPFGLTGPRRDWLADDTVASAAGGMAWLGGDPGGPPVPAPRQQAVQLAGTHAVIASLLALIARDRTGTGQLVDISVQESVAVTLETGAISWIHAGTVPGRTSGVYGHVAHRVFAAADGHVAGGYSGPDRMWSDLVSWMAESGQAGELAEARWQDPVFRWAHRGEVDEAVGAFVRRFGAERIGHEGRARSLPWAAVSSPADTLANPQLLSRDFFVDLDFDGDRLRDSGFPYRSPGRPAAVTRPRPIRDPGWSPRARPASSCRPVDRGALTGVRVLDLTWVLAGPYVTRTLGDHGADIVKVESRHRQDPTRFSPSMRLRPAAGPDDSGYFLNFNRNKRSLALNLRTPGGAQLLRQLAARVDLVIDNFSPGVLAKWGLDWPNLHELNPGAVLVSMAGVGATGPWRQAATFADTLAAMSGLTHETGGRGAPQGLTFGLGDMVAANAATVAALELLLAGRPGFVDLSQLEAMTAHLGSAVLEHQLPQWVPESVGPFVVATRGPDRWLAVGRSDPATLSAALRGLGAVAGEPSASLTALAAGRSAPELAQDLQGLGIAAYPVRDGRDLVTVDEQLAARGFWARQKHPVAGPITVEGIVDRLGRTPGALRAPAPLLGQHTGEILREYLGLDDDAVAGLRTEGVLE